MNADTNSIVSVTEANQNFSEAAQLADQYDPADEMQAASDEDVLSVSERLMKCNRAVYEELAK
ncbi:MAG: type II toxin-antitoxin system Phd/YefM family antitoxin [Ruminococcus sp.]|nr:type II toxin-antitoxin system Phd/YefM family antitoxin [Ruminococcus sp.]